MEKTIQDSTTEENKFYAEMDQQKFHQSCCTCQTMMILFSIILIILAGGIFYLYWQITREKVFSFHLPTISLQNFSQKINNLKADDAGNLQIALTDEDMTALLSEGLSFQLLLLKDIQVQILPNQMLIYGTLVKPLKSKVVIGTIPKPKNGQIDFEITSVSAGNFNFPKFLENQIGKSLTSLVNAKLSPVYQKFSVEEINLENNKLIIKGKAK